MFGITYFVVDLLVYEDQAQVFCLHACAQYKDQSQNTATEK